MKKLFAIIISVLTVGVMLCSCSGEKTTADIKDVDLDLTAISSTMVYSEVYNMFLTPDDFKGKTVKMRGTFQVAEDNETGKVYTACFVSDAAACCSQGLEFVLADESKKYPDDYPEVDTEIEVVGTFGTYNEGEAQFCYLTDAVMTVIGDTAA